MCHIWPIGQLSVKILIFKRFKVIKFKNTKTRDDCKNTIMLLSKFYDCKNTIMLVSKFYDCKNTILCWFLSFMTEKCNHVLNFKQSKSDVLCRGYL